MYFRNNISDNNCPIWNQSPRIPLCVTFHFKQNSLKFRGEHLQKQWSSSKSTLLDIALYRASHKTKHFEISGPNFPPRKHFRDAIYESNCYIWNQHPWIPLSIEFHCEQSILKLWDKICSRKAILGTKFEKTIVEFRICSPEYSFVLCMEVYSKQSALRPNLSNKRYCRDVI